MALLANDFQNISLLSLSLKLAPNFPPSTFAYGCFSQLVPNLNHVKMACVAPRGVIRLSLNPLNDLKACHLVYNFKKNYTCTNI